VNELARRPFQKRAGSRESVFLALDKPALRPLPALEYECPDYKLRRVPDNYHVEYQGFYYSVPYSAFKQQVTLKATHSLIEVYDENRLRIAVHTRQYTGKRYITIRAHMPANHQAADNQKKFDGKRYRAWAGSIGRNTHFVIDTLLNSSEVEEASYRACMGILQQAKKYGNIRLEAACRRARELGSGGYTTVTNILKNNQEDAATTEDVKPTPAHENQRNAVSFT
jgi:hypothetical protein